MVIGHVIMGRDVREVGSGNFGAANVVRAAGFKIGAAVAIIDILKGVVPVLAGYVAGLNHESLALVALAAVLGHDFSIFVGLKGGKGVATTLGVAVALAPGAGVLAAVVWLITFGILRYSSVSSLISLAALPVLMAMNHQGPPYVLVGLVLFILGWGKHWENILRLVRGREAGFEKRRIADGG